MNRFLDRWMNSAMRAPDDGGGAAPSADGAGGSSVTAGEAGAGGTPSGGGDVSPGVSPAAGEGVSDPGWSNLGSSDNLDHIEIPAEVVPPSEPAKPPVQPVPPPQPQPAPAPQQPAPAPATATDPQAGGAARPLSAGDPWRIAEGLEANRDAVIAHLAQSKFALSEEERP